MTDHAAPDSVPYHTPDRERTALMWLGAAAVCLSVCAALAVMTFDGTVMAAVLAALMSLGGVGLGYRAGRKLGPMPSLIRMRMFRVADELAQYRAFTKLLRDQGERITTSTGEAATAIVLGLREMDSNITRMQAIVAGDAVGGANELQTLVDAVGAPVVDLLGRLQFQDITEQQIAFLSRLSLLVDQHMIDLSKQMGDRRSVDRVGNFKDMFDRALDDCVMTSQRQDHHAAIGLDLKESRGPKIELF
ncbi:MAG: VTT domain-containing protein [Rhodospirillum sp.]|nr:VTT domain-containing protein [Rhodospirillum sp.]